MPLQNSTRLSVFLCISDRMIRGMIPAWLIPALSLLLTFGLHMEIEFCLLKFSVLVHCCFYD